MPPPPLAPDAVLSQFSVLDALLAGSYASGIPVGEVRRLGDFGLGCADHLGGEVVILDGRAFECDAGGPVTAMGDDETLPFVTVCTFPEGNGMPVAGADLACFTARVEAGLTSRNLFHAVRAHGAFSSLRVRATTRQTHPRPLAEVAQDQVESVIADARGTLVGFWAPAIYQGIAVAGLHLHFLSDDRSVGGHVLDVTVDDAVLRLAPYARFDLRLPTDEAFLRAELTHDEDGRIATVEGGTVEGGTVEGGIVEGGTVEGGTIEGGTGGD